MTQIEIIIDGSQDSIYYTEKEKNFINADIISNIIQNFNRDISEEKIEFIRYFNPKYDAWVLLKKDDDLQISNGLKILVKLDNFDENQFLKKKEIIEKINDLNKKIDNEFIKLNKQNNKKIRDLRPSRTFNLNNISENVKEKEKELDDSLFVDDSEDDNDFVDIIVLTANPLIDKNEKLIEEKELRTMNDFNSITHSIYNIILHECNKQIKAQFLPLTKNNLEFAFSQRPKILHLMCQSVYELENNKYKTNLLFENEKCEVDRQNEDDIGKIINSKELLKIDKDIINNVTLFISTPLSEDVFNIFKKFNFKNIIVQHTTQANIDFITELNEQLYLNIIKLNKTLTDAFDIAKKNSISVKHQFCCCYHEHKDDCKLKMYLSNELYSDSEKLKLKDIFIIPHFYHLRYKCKCSCVKGFCDHKSNCENSRFCFKPLYKNTKTTKLCCCDTVKKEHDLDHLFFCNFSEKNNEGIFSNYQSNNFCKIINKEFVPNYNKMFFIVGRNKIVYNIFDFLKYESCNIINIYGKQYKESINKIDKLIDMIIEFLKERIPYNLLDEENKGGHSDNLFLSKKNTMNFKNNKYKIFKEKMNSYDSSKFANLNLLSAESAPQVNKNMSSIPIYQKIYFYVDNHENISSIINNMKKIKNTIFFINGYKVSIEDLIKIFDQNNFFESKIILFTENKLSSNLLKNQEKYKINNIEFNSLTKEDYEIRLQNKKVELDKNSFDLQVIFSIFGANTKKLMKKQ